MSTTDIETWIVTQFANLLDTPAENIKIDVDFDMQDITSLDVVHIIAGAMRHFSLKLPREALSQARTIKQVMAVFDQVKSTSTR